MLACGMPLKSGYLKSTVLRDTWSPQAFSPCTLRSRGRLVECSETRFPHIAEWAPPGCGRAAGTAETQTWVAGPGTGPADAPQPTDAAVAGISAETSDREYCYSRMVSYAGWNKFCFYLIYIKLKTKQESVFDILLYFKIYTDHQKNSCTKNRGVGVRCCWEGR